MFGARTPRAALVGFALWVGVLAIGVGAAPTAATAAEPNRAAVIVDTGTEVHQVVITFDEDSISGVEALQLAGAEPEVLDTSPGAVVCALYGVGRPAEPGCTGSEDDHDNFWAYFQAPSDTATFDASSVDPASSEVRDGDVEGWKWGDGTAPEYVSLADLTGTTPTTTPPAGEEPPTTVPTTRPPASHPQTTPPPAVTPVAPRPVAVVAVPRAKPPVAARVVPKRTPTLPLTGGVAKSTTTTTLPPSSTDASALRDSAADDTDDAGAAIPSESDRFAGAALASSHHGTSMASSYLGLGLVIGAIIGASILYQTRKRPATS